MSRPAIVVVDGDRAVSEGVAHWLRRRYDGGHEVVSAASADSALAVLQTLHRDDHAVALVVAAEDVAGTPGARVLAAARQVHPDAGRLLLTATASVDVAVREVNDPAVQRYVAWSGGPPEQRLYAVLDDLLDDWRTRARTPYLVVEAVMDTGDLVGRIRVDATLLDAARAVAETRVSDLMVVEDDGVFVGVLSEGDILRNALPDFDEIIDGGGSLRDAYRLFVARSQALAATPILPLVIRSPIVLAPRDHVAQAATILVERQIRRLPVVADGRLVGTVSRANICRAVVCTPLGEDA